MHVHANYSQQMASLGAGQPTSHEIAARRSAEVRKKLSIAASALNEAGDEITAVHARADERADEGAGARKQEQRGEPAEDEFGRLFSARV